MKRNSNLNVLLIIVDTLRADRVGYSGYNIETPHMDFLASGGTRFMNTSCQYPMTLPSHVSIMTSTFPQYHGIKNNGNYFLEKSFTTLAEVLKERGFATSAFIGSVVLESKYGLSQGFDHYDDAFKTPDYLEEIEHQNLAQDVFQSAKNWFAKNYKKKFFMWLHFYDPHAPYIPPPPFDEIYKSPYDGEVAYTDVYVGKMIDILKEKNVYDQTLVVLTSDHGEGLGEHDESTHGLFLYDTTLKVPLVFHCPGIIPGKKVVEGQARTVDIMPTILDVLKIKAPDSIQGVSLVPWMEKKNPEELYSYAETYFPFLSSGWSPLKSIRTNRYKFIKAPKPELYDSSIDPKELENKFEKDPKIAREMLKELEKIETMYRAEAASGKRTLSPEEREKLASLGYVSFFEEEDLKKTGLADPKDMIQIFNQIQTADNLLGEGKLKEARMVLDRALSMDPDNPGIHYLLAQMHFGIGRFEEAIPELNKVLRTNKRNTTTYLQLGLCYLNLGKNSQAEKEFAKIFQITPEDADSLSVISTAYKENKNLSKSKEYIERAIALDKENIKLRLKYAEILELMREDENALREFEFVIARDPNNPQAYLGLGLFHLNRKNLDKGITYLERSLALSPSPVVYFTLGLAYRISGRNKEALESLEKYLEIAPTSEGDRIKIAQQVIASLKNKQ